MTQSTTETLQSENEALKKKQAESLATLRQMKRELDIEAALEKVRARTMAMQRSDELQDAALLLSRQLKALEVPPIACGFNIWDDDKKASTAWMATQDTISPPFKISSTEDIFVSIHKAAESGESLFVLELSDKELETHLRYLASIPGFKTFTEKIFHEGHPIPAFQVVHCAFFSQGYLTFVTYQRVAEAYTIFKRFAKVFEQTYTRFLDLQKAEAQAREAKVEAALERTRTQSMLMQHSNELDNTLRVFHEQVLLLGINSAFSFLWLPDEDKDRHIFWAVWAENVPNDSLAKKGSTVFKSKAINYPLDRREPATAQCLIDWKGKEAVVSYHVQPAGVESYFAAWQELIAGVEQLKPEYFSDGLYYVEAFMKYGCFGVMIKSELPEEEKKILSRFAIEFERAYTRFLDLQKAEAQARESQIEAALEKVRSRSMGMQKSEELKEVIQVVYEQFVYLNIHIEHTGFVMDYKARDDYNIWVADPRGVPSQLTIPYFDSVYYNRFNEAKEKGEDFFATNLTFEEKNSFYQTLFEYVPGLPEEVKEFYFSCPGLAASTVLLEDVCLYIENFSGIPYSDEDNNTLMRFGRVFQQTYTRFLDLQKAEEQARESQIETALERVRSRSMGMQKSEELRDVIQVIYEQLSHLNFKISNVGFLMDYRESDDYNIWMTDASIEFPTKQHIPYFDHPFNYDYLEHRDKGPELFTKVYPFEEKNSWWEIVWKHIAVPEDIKNAVLSSPALAISRVFMKNIGLYSLNFEGTPFSEAENATFIRFGKVFEQTYTRFNDLKQAESQALEAIKRASVDRVRAEIASMRTTSDLERITPLIWNELTILGVPFIRCGVFILDEEHAQVHTFLSTPEGKAILSFTSPISSQRVITEALPYWRRKEIYKTHWDEAAFLEQVKNLVQQGAISSSDTYLTENRPKNLYLHFFPFLQGILYVGNVETLNDEHLQLVQALADAFSTAYARYEDFNKLESANLKIEKTLVDLKQTQAQLVQSEKMASLGELTAGIAHEIQNPLNFVNNFAEVNKELLAELNDEIEKGNYEEVKVIAKDVTSNEEKISHHGKRADAIVKGMLQHSRAGSATKESTDINKLADEYLRLAYHGLRAKDKLFNATMKCDYDEGIGNISIFPQDIGRVLLNLYNNAFYAITEKKKQNDDHYQPLVQVTTQKLNGKVEITVKDNGNGIPQKVKDKIFQPFFTTKPTGQGTGLGLSLSYDIVKAHGGEIRVDTNEGEFTEFIIQLPA